MAEITDSLPEFSVYDAETGEPVEAANEITVKKVRWARFDITDDGQLAVVFVDSWDDFGSEILQRVGKYLVQIGDMKVRW